MTRRRPGPLGFLAATALLAAAPLSAQSSPDAMPNPQPVDVMLVGADVQLALRSGTRGTRAPIHLQLKRAGSARRGGKATGPLPVTLRVDFAPAMAFATAADSMLARKDGPARGDSLVATLAGDGGTLALVRLPDDGKKAAYRLHVATAAGTTTAVPDEPEATAIALFLRDLGERLDPEAAPDYSRTFERESQVDKPVVPAPGGCQPLYPETLRRERAAGEVVASFVVSSIGIPDPATFKAIRATHPDFEKSVRASLGCMRFLPAELRGRPVRKRVMQPFTFSVVGR